MIFEHDSLTGGDEDMLLPSGQYMRKELGFEFPCQAQNGELPLPTYKRKPANVAGTSAICAEVACTEAELYDAYFTWVEKEPFTSRDLTSKDGEGLYKAQFGWLDRIGWKLNGATATLNSWITADDYRLSDHAATYMSVSVAFP